MSHWPQPFQAPYHQLTVGLFSAASTASTVGGLSVPASFALAANLLECVPFRLARPATYRTAWWMNGATVNGTIIAGIYDGVGTKLVETADTTQSGANTIQSVAIGPITLPPGSYYAALFPSSATATFFIGTALTVEEQRHQGLHRQTEGSHVMPATLTISGSSGADNSIVFGLATQTVV